MMTVLTTQSDSWLDLGDITVPIMSNYARKNNYCLRVVTIPPAFEFHKVAAILGLLKRGDDLILCLDLDILITNHNIKFENFVDNEHDFYITQDINEINVGSVIVKKSKWVEDMLYEVVTSKAENEQNALKPFMTDPKVKILPHPSINSYPYDEYAPNWGLIPGRTPLLGIKGKPTHEQGDWQKGDFIAHVPGLAMEHRLEVLGRLKEHIIL